MIRRTVEDRPLAGVSEQFRQSDVTGWGIAAIACAGFAVLVANVSALVPQSTLAGLHLPRTGGVSLAQLRQQMAELQTESVQLRRQNEILTTRFSLQEQTGNEVIRRVGALEVSMPALMDLPSSNSAIDRSVTTASIGEPSQSFDAEGGSVVVRQSPMPQPLANSAVEQPLPATIATANAPASAAGYGVSIGSSFAAGQGDAQWLDLEVRLGSLLIDMQPLVTSGAFTGEERLVAGPIDELSTARDLCARIEQINIACAPVAYEGAPLVE